MKKSLALIAFMSTCTPAHAQQFGTLNILFCERTHNVQRMLETQFGESVIFQGREQRPLKKLKTFLLD